MSERGTRGARRRSSRWSRSRIGQATVEFAVVSIIFLMIVLGSVDFGRAVYMYSELTNAVREGARYGQVDPTDTSGIKSRVIDQATGLGLQSGDIVVACSSGCTTGSDITVRANMDFSLVAQGILGIAPFTMHAHATVAID